MICCIQSVVPPDGLSAHDFVLGHKFEVRAFGPQVGTNPVADILGFGPDGHAHSVALVFAWIPKTNPKPENRDQKGVLPVDYADGRRWGK